MIQNNEASRFDFKAGDKVILTQHDNGEYTERQGLLVGAEYTVQKDCSIGARWLDLVEKNNNYYAGLFKPKTLTAAEKRRVRIAAAQAEAKVKAEAAEKAKREKILTTYSIKKGVTFSPTIEAIIKDFGCHEAKVRTLMARLFLELKKK